MNHFQQRPSSPVQRGEPPGDLHDNLRLLAQQFTAVSGISCHAVDGEGRPLTGAREAPPPEAGSEARTGCGLCRFLGEGQRSDTCNGVAIHGYGVGQAQRFGGSFVYFCPANLVYWASPVSVHGQVVGALIAGSVLMNEPDDYLGDDVEAFLGRSTVVERERLQRLLRSLPYVPPARVSALARVLSDMAYSLSQKLANNALWETHVEAQQARISEYIHQLKIDSETIKSPDYPVARERELLSLIAQGDYANANQLLNELLGFVFFSSGREMGLIKARILELVVLMSRAALEGGAAVDAILKMNNTFLAQVQKTASIEDLSVSLAAMLKRFADCVARQKSTRHAGLIQKAVQFLNAHYAQPIDLQTVASHLHISTAHFSKVFKEETGQGFVHLLNQVRVERSKDLLRDHSISLAEIAELVGFADQSYYTKVFRKHTGMSPGQFRKNRGRLPESNLEIHESAQRGGRASLPKPANSPMKIQ